MTKYNKPELIDALCKIIGEGIPIEHACAAVGISHQTYYDWLKLDDIEPRIRKAEYDHMQKLLKKHAKATDQAIESGVKSIGHGLNALQWSLERRFPKHYGRQDKMQIQGDSEKPLSVTALIELVNGNGSNTE